MLLSSMALASTHTHLADQGHPFDLSCPLCNFLMGLVFCMAAMVVPAVTLEGFGAFLPTAQRFCLSETVSCIDPRAPPSR